jgi:leader peptidase (prepilin peptidase)/N-methyltransferase
VIDVPNRLVTAYLVTAALVGLVVGSFLNVVILRLPRMLEARWKRDCAELSGATVEAGPVFNLAYPGSHCPGCGHPIPPWANIPVLSWLLLRGRCHFCHQPISVRYPVIELAAGLGAFLCAWGFDHPLKAIGAMVLVWILIALAFIDFDHKILPDGITIPGLWLGLILNSFDTFVPLRSALWGAIAGYLFLWAVYQAFRLLTGKEGLGYGDFKLLALLGAWLGATSLVLIILVASAIGAVTGIGLILAGRHQRADPLPFGPFLAGAGIIALAFGPHLVTLWLAGLHPP